MDGHFYIGATKGELRFRLQKHKASSKEHPDRPVYKYITNWNDVKIILIEKVNCNTREELNKKEDEFIQKELENPLCLNHRRAHNTEEDKKKQEHTKQHTFYNAHKDAILETKKEITQERRDEINARRRELRASKKVEKVKEPEIQYPKEDNIYKQKQQWFVQFTEDGVVVFLQKFALENRDKAIEARNKYRESHPKITQTNHKYIFINRTTFECKIAKEGKFYRSSHKTLEEAIKARDLFLNIQ